MSLARPLLNRWLRWTEKPYLARATTPEQLRRGFERKARLFFHGPGDVHSRKKTLADVPTLHLSAPEIDQGPHILYFHGGAYVFGSPATHQAMLARLCRDVPARASLPNYRKAPEHPFPAALQDAVQAWSALLDAGISPDALVIGGDSAGGGLALALLGHLLKSGLPCPAGVFVFSPLTDLTFSGESIRENAKADVILPAARVEEMAQTYLQGRDPKDPEASPLFADFASAPPAWMVVGDTEILRDDSVRLADRMRAQGVDVTLHLERDLPHVWPIFHNYLPEARATLSDLAVWIRQRTELTAEN